MILEKEVGVSQKTTRDLLPGWYKSSERARHPHPKKIRVECSLDEDVVRWLEERTREDEEFPIYINHYLRKVMDLGLDKKL